MHLDDRVSIETYYGKAIVYTVRTQLAEKSSDKTKETKNPSVLALSWPCLPGIDSFPRCPLSQNLARLFTNRQ